jgi:hypothetical protein
MGRHASAAPEFAAQGGPAHLQLEPTRLGGVTDCASGDADDLPQHNAAEHGKATAPCIALTESCTHTTKRRSATTRLHG